MNPVHRIRLGSPWEVSGTRHVRKFGRPRTIDPIERVWLVVEGTNNRLRMRLNERELDGTESAWDVTEMLEPRNQLEVELEEGTELGAVSLEIRMAN